MRIVCPHKFRTNVKALFKKAIKLIHLLIHSLIAIVTSTYYMASPFLGEWDTSLSKTDKYACPHGAYLHTSRDRI